jgi:pimeloyl-ACP methyl ester carboxylesterase
MNTTSPHIESGFVNVNETSIYYEKAGNGKPVILVHGFALDCRIWNLQFPALADQFQLIRYDARGFGRSALPTDKPYSHHEDLHQIMQSLDISKACFIGHSMGGRIVLDHALTYPGSCSSLVLVDAALHGYVFKTFSLDKPMLVAKETDIKRANEEWLQHELFQSAHNNPAAFNTLKEIIDAYSGWHWLHKNPWTPLDPPSLQQLYKIVQPTLIITGEQDLPDFQMIADILSQQIPHSKKTTIPNAGHVCNMENAALFNETTAKFINAPMC